MLATLVVAIVTVGLLVTGAFVVSNNQEVPQSEGDGIEYSEDFFGSLDSLVGGLKEKADQAPVTEGRSERYQRYIEAKDKAAVEPKANLFLNIGKPAPKTSTPKPSTPEAPTPVIVKPEVEIKTPEPAQETVPSDPDVGDLNDILYDFDLDLGELNEFDF